MPTPDGAVDGERDGADETVGGIGDVDLEEAVRQVGVFSHIVDRLPDGPKRRDGDELRLHPPSGGVLRVVEAALEGDALGRGQPVEDLGLLVLVEPLEEVDGVIRIELAHAGRDRRGG